MPVDRFKRAHEQRLMHKEPAPFEGGSLRMFTVRGHPWPPIKCTNCLSWIEVGAKAYTHVTADGALTYHHAQSELCRSITAIRAERRMEREEQQQQMNQEIYMTTTTIDPAVIAGFAKEHDVYFVVLLASRCGWHGVPNHNGSLAAIAPDGIKMTIPDNTGLQANVFRSWVKKIWTHTEPDQRPDADAMKRLIDEARLDPWHASQVWRATGLDQPVEPAPLPPEPEPEPEPEPLPAPTEPAGERRIVSTMPFISHKGKKSQTVSPSVLVQTWSDGTVTYKCSWPDCPVTHDRVLGIIAHYKQHTNEFKRAQGLPTWQRRPLAKSKAKTPKGVAAARELAEQAKAEPEPVVETTPEPEPDSIPRGMDEAEEVLDAITDVDELTDEQLDQALFGLISAIIERRVEARVEDLRERLNVAEARAARAEGDINALRELLRVN